VAGTVLSLSAPTSRHWPNDPPARWAAGILAGTFVLDETGPVP
jgi:hypothetical protein